MRRAGACCSAARWRCWHSNRRGACHLWCEVLIAQAVGLVRKLHGHLQRTSTAGLNEPSAALHTHQGASFLSTFSVQSTGGQRIEAAPGAAPAPGKSAARSSQQVGLGLGWSAKQLPRCRAASNGTGVALQAVSSAFFTHRRKLCRTTCLAVLAGHHQPAGQRGCIWLISGQRGNQWPGEKGGWCRPELVTADVWAEPRGWLNLGRRTACSRRWHWHGGAAV